MSHIKNLIIVFIALTCHRIEGQVYKKSYTKNHQKVNISKSIDKWKVNVLSLEMGKPGGNSYSSFLNEQKNKQLIQYPRRNPNISPKKQFLSDSIVIENEFEGNLYNNKVPNDNTIAISNDGILIEAINSSYIIYDTQDNTLLKLGTLHEIVIESFWDLRFHNKYDPKIIYDPDENKFILVFLIGTAPSNNHVCVTFIDADDPLGTWNVYVLTGDALDTEHWTDYPAISITKDHLFITGNLLINGVSWQEGFYQSIIWQIDKHNGYNGNDSLTFNLWSEFKDNSIYLRNIHPVRGARELQSNKQYFLSNKNFSLESDTLYLVKIEDNPVTSVSTSSVKRLSLPDHYFLSPNGQQYNGQELSTNDSRVLGGIIDEDWIQFVHHSMDTSSGTSGIYHGIIYDYDVENPYIRGTIISDTAIDFGYPNITSTGINVNETECIIGFNYSSVNDTNGLACVYMKDNLYTNFKVLHKGTHAIDILTGNVERWGDYFGIQRKYDEPCKVWISGMYGKLGANGSWISNIAVSDTCRVADPTSPFTNIKNNKNIKDGLENLLVYPNPAEEMSSIEFNVIDDTFLKIEIHDINGVLINVLYQSRVKKGKNRLSFNISHLKSGVYFVNFIDKENILLTKKLIKQ